MQVFDEISGKRLDSGICCQVVVEHLPNQIIFGFVSRDTEIEDISFFVNGSFTKFPAVKHKLKDILVYSNNRGMYISAIDVPEEIIVKEMYTKGAGRFPYKFDKRYEACENFNIFLGKQRIINPDKSYLLSEFIKYSFGLEFETSQGYIPEDICFRDGLIPLRDGSIAGVEYSTVVLSGNNGIALLEQQLNTLKKYTDFNKECSLHIHFGGFPLNKEKLFNLYILCKHMENELSRLVPTYTFHTSEYKANHKDYCNKLPVYRNFDQMYEHLVGRKFFNDFTQPHPNDIRREAKWRIPTR